MISCCSETLRAGTEIRERAAMLPVGRGKGVGEMYRRARLLL
jgi:hypothetical protein